jgi:hypothetical protein
MITYKITGKLYERGVKPCSYHTVTETIDAINHDLAVKKYRELNPGYAITEIRPVSVWGGRFN